jgi:hypothetical protein
MRLALTEAALDKFDETNLIVQSLKKHIFFKSIILQCIADIITFHFALVSNLSSPGILLQVVGVQLLLQVRQTKAENILILRLETNHKNIKDAGIV